MCTMLIREGTNARTNNINISTLYMISFIVMWKIFLDMRWGCKVVVKILPWHYNQSMKQKKKFKNEKEIRNAKKMK